MIEVSSITKFYKRLCAVDNVSFSIKKGESFALLGPNGAGKTSIVKMILNFTKIDSGTITINNHKSTTIKSREKIGFLAENHKIPSYMTGKEYILCGASFLNLENDYLLNDINRVLKIVGMEGKENQKAKTYSKGMTQRIGLAAAMIGDPDYLILDEPTSGLDPFGVRDFRKILEELNNKGVTIFLNSHNLSEVEKCCNTVGIINHGKLLVHDKLENIITENESLEDVFVKCVEDYNG